jgi:hypothetical protein
MVAQIQIAVGFAPSVNSGEGMVLFFLWVGMRMGFCGKLGMSILNWLWGALRFV